MYHPPDAVPTAESLQALIHNAPPHATDSERGLLACLMRSPASFPLVAEIVQTSEAFYMPQHAALFDEIAKDLDRASVADPVAISDRLNARGYLDAFGGLDGLIDLFDAEPVADDATAVARAQVVADCYVRRKTSDLAARMIYKVHESHGDLPGMIDGLGRDFLDVARLAEPSSVTTGPGMLSDLIGPSIEAVQSEQKDAAEVETGYHDLDAKYGGGLSGGELLILAARPSMGKTAVALGIAQNIAISQGRPVGMFSLEMRKQSLVQRLIASEAGVDAQRLRMRQLTEEDRVKIQNARRGFEDSTMIIDDTPELTLMQLRQRARRMVHESKVCVILIDYLQLLSAPGYRNREGEVSAMSRGIKGIARELGIPVVCLSQLNRAVEGRTNRRPQLSDLRESGSIEQDADIVSFVYREDYYRLRDDPDATPDDVVEIITAKQRNGPTGTTRLMWRGWSASVHNVFAARGAESEAQPVFTYDEEVMP